MKLFVFLSTVCITLFLVMTFFLGTTKRGNRKANRYLAVFFFLWAIDFLDALLFFNGFYLNNVTLAFWSEPLVFLYGPLVYFYSRSIFEHLAWRSKDFIHFIPSMVLFLLIIVFYHLQPISFKSDIVSSVTRSGQNPGVFIVVIIVYAHFFCYVFYAKKLMQRTKERLNNYYSNYSLTWLQNILNSLTIILAISFSIGMLHYFFPSAYFNYGLPLIAFFVGLILLKLVLTSMEQPVLDKGGKISREHGKNRIDKDVAQSISNKITKALNQEKLFLQPELTIEQLANTIGEEATKVSMVINDVFQKSFFELINGYRIEAAKQILRENKDAKTTILEVMYDVGFNSKSSFNTQFKNITGITPSEYRKLHN